MAGDWIKMRTDLFTHPKVVRISSALNADRLRTVGGLMSVWCLFDAHSFDGQLEGYTFETVDDLIGWKGFAAAMNKVGWLDESHEGLALPRFDTHNGTSAKRRAQETGRKREARSSASDADKKRTREEKRREEEKEPPNPPSPTGDEGAEVKVEKTSKRERKPRTALKTFLAACRANGVKPVTTYAPLMEYVEGVGLPADFLELAWDVFCHEHLDGGTNAATLQADWQRHFTNYVSKGYYRLWVCKPDGSFELTSVGQQAKQFHNRRAA